MRFLGYLFSFGVVALIAAGFALAGVVWWYGRDLPDVERLSEYRPDELSRVFASDGSALAEFAREQRVFTPVDEIPDLVKHAFISAEDKNFYKHHGVDYIGVAKAMVQNVQALMNNGNLRGASTITQQVIKNLVLTNERSVERKIKEAILAVRLEQEVSKDRVLELYLNEIFLGARSYGVTAAAQNYFGKALAELNPEEVAYLASLPKFPSSLHPVRNRSRALSRRNWVLKEMWENGHISRTEAEDAQDRPLETRLSVKREAEETRYDWDSAYLIEEARGKLIEEFGEGPVYGGGLIVRTTLDPAMQQAARTALTDRLHAYDRGFGYRGPVAVLEDVTDWRAGLKDVDAPRDIGDWRLAAVLSVSAKTAEIGVEGEEEAQELPLSGVEWARKRRDEGVGPEIKAVSDVLSRGDVVYVAPEEESWSLRQIPEVNGAVIALDPFSGRVLAMQGGISAQDSKFNRVTQAARQPGSSFKPFVYAAAFDSGYTPASIVLDAPVTVDQGNDEGYWKPQNYEKSRFYGPTPLRIGLEKSRNLITVRLAQDIGMEKIADYAHRFGVYDDMPKLLSYSLGAGETTLEKMAAAYAIFINGGRRVEPVLIERVQDRFRKTLYRGDARLCEACAVSDPTGGPVRLAQGEQVIDPVTAYQVVSLLEGVAKRGTATKLQRLGFPVGGKTGTTNESRDAWFVGGTADLVFGCYIGFDNPKSLGRRASGGALCGPVFENFMRAAYDGKAQPGAFRRPEGVEMARIDRMNGKRVPEDVESPEPGRYIFEAFREGTAPELEEIFEAPEISYFPTPGQQQGGQTAAVQPGFQPVAPPPVSGTLAPVAPQGGVLQPQTQPANPFPAQPGVQPQPVVTAPLSDPNEPLIRIDPETGDIIVAQDSIVQIAPQPGVVIQPSAPAFQPVQPILQPAQPVQQPAYPAPQPPQSRTGTSIQGVYDGHGLY